MKNNFNFNNNDSIDKDVIKKPFTKQFVSPGHFYSPIPDLNEIEKYKARLFNDHRPRIEEVDLQTSEQLHLLDKMSKLYMELPFKEEKNSSNRFFFNNPAFGYGDAITLFSLIRIFNPHKYIEVGSGYSSCAALDTDELFLKRHIEFTFIEPYPDLLFSLIKDDDKERVNIIPKKLQDIDVKYFEKLDKGDFLFFDSSHVCKAGSDVQYIFFEILPRLKKGVYIHFHDIFYPFEYPEEWLMEGRAWNELYILHAFLQNNDKYRIIYFNNYIGKVYRNLVQQKTPNSINNIGGSFWLKKK